MKWSITTCQLRTNDQVFLSCISSGNCFATSFSSLSTSQAAALRHPFRVYQLHTSLRNKYLKIISHSFRRIIFARQLVQCRPTEISPIRDKKVYIGIDPKTSSFVFWHPLLHLCIDASFFRHSSLLVHSFLTPSLFCTHFLLVLLSTLWQDFVLLTPSGASPLRHKTPYEKNVHPRDVSNHMS